MSYERVRIVSPDQFMLDIGTQILFQDLPEAWEDRVRSLLPVSRLVLRSNRNRHWNRPINLITDSLDIVREKINPDFLHERDSESPWNSSQYIGYCWSNRTSNLLWATAWEAGSLNTYNRTRRSTSSIASTLCHEVAHALAGVGHNRQWRRAYAILLPFWLYRLSSEPEPTPIDVRNRWFDLQHLNNTNSFIYTAVQRYAKLSPENAETERLSHMIAQSKVWARWKHLVV